MKAFVLTLAGLLLPTFATLAEPAATSTARVVDLRVERMTNPTAVNTPLPRFSWRIETEQRGWLQKSYHLLVASTPELLAQDKGDLWDSGESISRLSHFITFKGVPFESGQKGFWKVKVQSSDGAFSAWSEPAAFTIKLSGPTPAPESLFSKEGPRLSSFESSDAGLNETYASAGSKVHELKALSELGIALRGASFHQSPFPAAGAWFDQLNASSDGAGFYPASLPATGSFGSLQSDAVISSGHALWWMSGDPSLFQRHVGDMKNHVLARSAFDPAKTGLPFGSLPEGTLPAGDPTPPEFIHFASQVLNLRLISDMGRYCSRDPYDLFIIQKLQESYQKAFAKNFAGEDGLLKERSLTSLLFSIRCGLYQTEPARKAAAAELLKLAKSKEASELLGLSPLVDQSLLPTLTWLGEGELALKIAQAQDPAALSPLTLTTTSEWLISTIAGIDTDGPGFQQVRIKPHIPGNGALSFAKAHYDGPNGRIAVHWETLEDKVVAKVTIPPNTAATVSLPLAEGRTVSEKGTPVKGSKMFFNYQEANGTASFSCGSGTYEFVVE